MSSYDRIWMLTLLPDRGLPLVGKSHNIRFTAWACKLLLDRMTTDMKYLQII